MANEIYGQLNKKNPGIKGGTTNTTTTYVTPDGTILVDAKIIGLNERQEVVETKVANLEAKIDNLDSIKTQNATEENGYLNLNIVQENGLITNLSGSISPNKYDKFGAASEAESRIKGNASSSYDTLGKLEDGLITEVARAKGVEDQLRLAIEEIGGESAGLDKKINDEIARAKEAEALEKSERTAADNNLQLNLNNEESARIAKDTELNTKIETEIADRKAADNTLDDKKVDKSIVSSLGKAMIFNEADGGGAKFDSNDGTSSFAGVNNETAAGIGAQLYDINVATNSGSKLDVTLNGIYYTKDAQSAQAPSARDVEANELAVKKNVADEKLARENADNTLQANINTETNTRETADTALSNRVKVFETNGDLDVAAIKNRVAVNENDISGLKSRCSTIEQAADALKVRVTTAEGNIENHTTRLNTAEATIVEHTNKITNVENDIRDTVKPAIRTNTENIASEVLNRQNADTILDDKIDDLDTQVNTRIAAEETNRANADTTLGNTISTVATNLQTETANRISADSTLQTNIDTEVQARKDAIGSHNIATDAHEDIRLAVNAEVARATGKENELVAKDIDLQNQIDALASRTDVVDVVGTKAALDAYDVSKIEIGNIVKVLKDESQGNATSYYRLISKTDANKWNFVGKIDAYYTKSEADEKVATAKNEAIDSAKSYTNTSVTTEKTRAEGVEATLTSNINTINNTTIPNAIQSAKDYTNAEIQKLDAAVDQAAGADGLILHIKEVDGKVTELTGSIKATTYDAYGAASAVQSALSPRCTDLETKTLAHDVAIAANTADIANKLNKLTAGANISIVNDTISAIDTKYLAGHGINVSGNTISVKESDLTTKVDKPVEPVAGQGLNIPYYFDVKYTADKATVTDYTVDLLDNTKAPKTFNLDIKGATTTSAGLMSASDKTKLDGIVVPTKTSELTNDSGFITASAIPTNVSAFTNDAGYLTTHQSLAGYATETWVEGKGYLTSHQDISGKVNISDIEDDLFGFGVKDKPLSANQGFELKTAIDGEALHRETGDNLRVLYTDVIDNVTSTDTNKPLSANQGKVLKAALDAEVSRAQTEEAKKADKSDTYTKSEVYTKAEVNTAISNAITAALTNFFASGVKAITTAPTEDKPEAEQNNLTFVVLNAEPANKYKGYFYIITE